LKDELLRTLRAAVLENYDRLIEKTNNTGVLREAVEEGTLALDDILNFSWTIANKPGKCRPWADQSEPRLSTHEYGPLVFQGRAAIQTFAPDSAYKTFRGGEKKSMVFMTDGGYFTRRRVVAAAEARNILALTPEQIEKVDRVLVKGLSEDISAWIQEVEAQSGGHA
jgi:hypothetical protein